MKTTAFAHLRRLALALSLGAAALGQFTQVLAATTDLANAPLSSTQANAKPNLMFVLDSSGSMASDYMPDEVANNNNLPPQSWGQNYDYTNTYGYRSAQCNGLAYNPDLAYSAPVTSQGNSYPDMSATAAWGDGFQPSLKTSPARLRTTTSAAMDASSSGVSKTFTIDSSPDKTSVNSALATYSSLPTVVIYSYDQGVGSQAQWMMGKVTGYTTNTITVLVTFSTTDATTSYASWIIGQPSTSSLSTRVYYAYNKSGSTPEALSWTFDTSGTALATTFFNQCKAYTTTASTFFTGVTVSTLTAAQQSNYANWYSYYRTRLLSVRSAAGRSFKTMTDNFRVGFTVISDPYAVDGSNGFVSAGDFDSTQKKKFYDSLYSADASNYTPLRGALSKMGRYYANAAPGQTGNLVTGQSTATADPVQYSCQRNYALLSTDGYWNTNIESSSKQYGPYKVDGQTTVGQQDGFDVRPQYDGSVTTRTDSYVFGYTFATATPITVNYAIAYTGKAEVTTYSTGTVQVKTGGTAKKPIYTTYNTYTKKVTNQGASASMPSYNTTTETKNYSAQQTRTVTYTNGIQTSDVTSPAAGPTITQVGNASRTTEAFDHDGTLGSWTAKGTITTTVNDTCTDNPVNTCSAYKTAYTNTGGSPSTVYLNQTPGGKSKTGEAPGQSAEGSHTPFQNATTSTTTTTAGYTDSLADVAEYYYVTPFRKSTTVNCMLTPKDDNCKGDLSPSDIDTASYQHMTTFTLGLGVNGNFKYDPKYLSQASGDYFNVTRGKDDSNNTVNWPMPYNPSSINLDVPGKIDDLWHAAVNGRGRYFTSSDPKTLSAALDSTLNTVIAASGYGGSAAASSLKPVLGTDLVFLASYTTVTWSGDVKAFKLNVNANNEVVPVEQMWSAADTLNARLYSSRKIYYAGQVSSNGKTSTVLKDFNYTNLSADNLNGNFDKVCDKSPTPLQCSTLTTDLKTAANTGSSVVDFIRGDRSNEISVASTEHPFRTRTSVLGDIINASPVFVGAPPFQYGDAGYGAYVTAQVSRKKVIYAAANDGMLHAFSGVTGSAGSELWAFVPTAVMPNLYRLVDTNYANGHRYYVDGSPVVGDVYDGSNWRTILVGGLNKGGKSYYALDVTDPDSPSLLWEIDNTQSDFSNLGYTYGNPLITKVKDPSNTDNWIWAVAFTSGHNNIDNGGDGNGSLFVVNAVTGARLYKVDTTYKDTANKTTNAGSTTTPSGLSKINAWITSEANNQAERFYGGDLLGNLWRFDVNGLVEPKNSALRLAQFQTSATSTDAQPIMVRPELAEVGYGGARYPVVLIGTGKYLGTTDLQTPTDATAAQQAIYAIKDPMTSTGWGPIRGSSNLVAQTLVDNSAKTVRTIPSPNKVDWTANIGWTVALPTAKERVAIDMNMQYNTLGVISHVPEGTACSPSGKSWIYFLNVATGAAPTVGTEVGNVIESGLGTGITWFDLGNGESTVLVPDDKLGIHAEVPPVTSTTTTNPAKRVSWRELVN
jgi:type IV pilus assembly protein PilY1